MSSNLGDEAERFIAKRIACPSCGGRLRVLPPGYPLFDVQCVSCLFRAQTKRVKEKARSRLRGGSWSVVNLYLRTGNLLPPMLVCFDWPEGKNRPGAVYFFPFVPAKNVKRRILSSRHKTDAGRAMAEYLGMLALPHQILFPSSISPQKI